MALLFLTVQSQWSKNDNVFVMLWRSIKNCAFVMLCNNVIQFHTTVWLPGTRIQDRVDWEDLPLELLGVIGIRMSNRFDILSFRSVCKKWQSSLPFPTRFPLRVPSPTNKVPCMITRVSNYRRKVRGPMVFEEVGLGERLYGHLIQDPVTSFKGLSFVSESYHLRVALPRTDDFGTELQGHFDVYPHLCVQKMVIISANADGVNHSYASLSDLSVAALLSRPSMKGRLALLRLRESFEDLVWDSDFCHRVFTDIHTYRGRLCASDRWGRVFLMDYHSLQMTKNSDCPSIKYLLED